MLITKGKKPIWEGHVLHDSNCMTLWRRQNYGHSRKIRVATGQAAGRGERAEHTGFLGQRNYSV